VRYDLRMPTYLHKQTIEALPDEPRPTSVDGGIQDLLERFSSIQEIFVVIHAGVGDRVDVRRYFHSPPTHPEAPA
jgi:hypothetical protein